MFRFFPLATAVLVLQFSPAMADDLPTVLKGEGEKVEQDTAASPERNRLRVFTEVVSDAANRIARLSEPQRCRLSEVLNTGIAAAMDGIASKSRRPSPAPICFQDTMGPVQPLLAEYSRFIQSNEVLSPEQSRILSAALDDRTQYRRQAALEYIASLLDDELFLTVDQKDQLTVVLQQNVNLDASCFHPKLHHSAGLTSSTVPVSPQDYPFLTELQQQRLEGLAVESITTGGGFGGSPTLPTHVRITTQESPEEWSQKLRDSFEAQRERLFPVLELPVQYYRTHGLISDGDAHRLRVAAKGVVDEVLQSWEARQLSNMTRFRNAAGVRNEVYYLRQIMPDDLENSELWKETLLSVLPSTSEPVQRRRHAKLSAMSRFATAQLDQELWLAPEQRERIQESIFKALLKSDRDVLAPPQFSELNLIAVPLFWLPESDLAILTQAQQAAVSCVRSHAGTRLREGIP
ncbi:MAG: hypothetical protein R3C49_02315 [Planctomycetaceae bacterium]